MCLCVAIHFLLFFLQHFVHLLIERCIAQALSGLVPHTMRTSMTLDICFCGLQNVSQTAGKLITPSVEDGLWKMDIAPQVISLCPGLITDYKFNCLNRACYLRRYTISIDWIIYMLARTYWCSLVIIARPISQPKSRTASSLDLYVLDEMPQRLRSALCFSPFSCSRINRWL